jgi:hypothetical protein
VAHDKAGALSAIYQLVRDAIVTEAMSVAGRINVFGMTLVFALVAADGTIDVVQAFVRIWRPNYHAGNPPVLILVAIMVALTLCCIVLVSLIDPLSLSSRRHAPIRDLSGERSGRRDRLVRRARTRYR